MFPATFEKNIINSPMSGFQDAIGNLNSLTVINGTVNFTGSLVTWTGTTADFTNATIDFTGVTATGADGLVPDPLAVNTINERTPGNMVIENLSDNNIVATTGTPATNSQFIVTDTNTMITVDPGTFARFGTTATALSASAIMTSPDTSFGVNSTGVFFNATNNAFPARILFTAGATAPICQFQTLLGNFANDAAAAAAFIPIGGLYRTGNLVKVRVI